MVDALRDREAIDRDAMARAAATLRDPGATPDACAAAAAELERLAAEKEARLRVVRTRAAVAPEHSGHRVRRAALVAARRLARARPAAGRRAAPLPSPTAPRRPSPSPPPARRRRAAPRRARPGAADRHAGAGADRAATPAPRRRRAARPAGPGGADHGRAGARRRRRPAPLPPPLPAPEPPPLAPARGVGPRRSAGRALGPPARLLEPAASRSSRSGSWRGSARLRSAPAAPARVVLRGGGVGRGPRRRAALGPRARGPRRPRSSTSRSSPRRRSPSASGSSRPGARSQAKGRARAVARRRRGLRDRRPGRGQPRESSCSPRPTAARQGARRAAERAARPRGRPAGDRTPRWSRGRAARSSCAPTGGAPLGEADAALWLEVEGDAGFVVEGVEHERSPTARGARGPRLPRPALRHPRRARRARGGARRLARGAAARPRAERDAGVLATSRR